MNNHRYLQDTMAKVVSSRRGSNFLLHNLEEKDVVFGTKGNGRNEVFLKVLENHSEQYMQLSKFQKMGLIQQIIRDWKGNFYILNSKTNDLHLAKKKDHELSTTDPSSRKLYTSVRRMMNYVNSKILRKPQHAQKTVAGIDNANIISGTTTVAPVIPVIPVTTLAPQAKTELELQGTQNPTTPLADTGIALVSKRTPLSMTSMDYIRNEHVMLTLADRSLPSSPFPTENVNIPVPKRSTVLISPEPSPRSAFMKPPPVSPLPLSRPELSLTNTIYSATPSPTVPFPSASATTTMHNNNNNCCTAFSAVPLSPRTIKTKHDVASVDNEVSVDLESSAILGLISLGSSSSI